MYKSGMTAAQLYAIVEADADISISVPKDMLALWINAVQQMLYSEIVREERFTALTADGTGSVLYTALAAQTGEAAVEGRDIVGVFDGKGKEFERVSGGIGYIMASTRPVWIDTGSGIKYYAPFPVERMQIAHVARPALVTAAGTEDICVPIEFVPMILARIRGEIYKLANEDGLSAKWLSDYNTELETFKVWAAQHGEVWGL